MGYLGSDGVVWHPPLTNVESIDSSGTKLWPEERRNSKNTVTFSSLVLCCWIYGSLLFLDLWISLAGRVERKLSSIDFPFYFSFSLSRVYPPSPPPAYFLLRKKSPFLRLLELLPFFVLYLENWFYRFRKATIPISRLWTWRAMWITKRSVERRAEHTRSEVQKGWCILESACDVQCPMPLAEACT